MNRMTQKKSVLLVTGLMTALLLLRGVQAHAIIDGETDLSAAPTFSFVAKQGTISLGDGSIMHMWGYGIDTPGGSMQYPGPTLIIQQGADVTIQLRNQLPAAAGNVAIIFPGHKATATGGVDGLFTKEAPTGGTVTYQFTADNPGTYLYHAGTGLQVEMGLAGAIIVRSNTASVADPPFPDLQFAYKHAGSGYHREYLYFLTEMDPRVHEYVAAGQYDRIDLTTYFATAWFINGRNFPDVMAEPFVPWLPTQPYNCQPRTHPGEKVLIRIIGAGRDLHPMHYHGADFSVIAQDGRLLTTTVGAPSTAPPDLQWKANTFRVTPGQTADAIWTWAGEGLGWDIYGHVPGDGTTCTPGPDGFDVATYEWCADHQVPFPVIIPPRDDLQFGQFWSGTPFLGGEAGGLPPGHPGLNEGSGYFYMWHSHTEKEIVTINLFPGGYITFMIVEHPDVPIP